MVKRQITPADQCRQIVRAGHRCPRAAKRDDFCDNHWRMRFGHLWNFDIQPMTCRRCKGEWKSVGETCLVSPYLDQPPSVYPEPTTNELREALQVKAEIRGKD